MCDMCDKMIQLPVAERVANGASLLDAKVPGWFSRINLSTLDICDGENCVLGQLFGDYEDGCEFLFHLGGSRQERAEHGVTLYNWDDETAGPMLSAAWEQAVRDRLNKI